MFAIDLKSLMETAVLPFWLFKLIICGHVYALVYFKHALISYISVPIYDGCQCFV
jgi:riboflavin transporter FmnP